MTIRKYRLWVAGPDKSPAVCGRLAIEESDAGRVSRVEFEYSPDYLRSSWAYSINPVELPLGSGIASFKSVQNNLPGFVDDLLPDRWGTEILTRYVLSVEGKVINGNNPCELLDHLPDSFVGALKAQSMSRSKISAPEFNLGIPIESLMDIGNPEEIMKLGVDDDMQVFGLHRLAQGSGLGGARPKVLCFDDHGAYIVKFPRSDDPFDVVAAEASCLEMAKMAGIPTPAFEILSLPNGRRALKLDRFDIAEDGTRLHLMTANALLKDQGSCEDRSYPSYGDIVHLIRRFSDDPESDLQQMFGQMLLNNALNNRDDHLRNFSFMRDAKGIKMTPAYDIVPNDVAGQYPFLRFGVSTSLPSFAEAPDAAKSFGLSREEGRAIIDRVQDSVKNWPTIFKKHGAKAKDFTILRRVLPEVDKRVWDAESKPK